MSKNEYKSYPCTDHLEALRLFKNFAQTLKQPLFQIARSAELPVLSQGLQESETAKNISLLSDRLIRLVDSYVFSLELQLADKGTGLQPVSLGALFTDVAHNLYQDALFNRCDIEVMVTGKFEPVLANAEGLQWAMMNLGQSLIEAQSHTTDKRSRAVVHLAVHRTGKGIVGGVFSDIQGLSASNLRRGRQLFGNADLPLNQLFNNAAADVFIADTLLSTMSSGLRTARFKKMQGLAATFTPSQQLTLVS